MTDKEGGGGVGWVRGGVGGRGVEAGRGIQFIYYLPGQEQLISEAAEEERRMYTEKYFKAIGDDVIFI